VTDCDEGPDDDADHEGDEAAASDKERGSADVAVVQTLVDVFEPLESEAEIALSDEQAARIAEVARQVITGLLSRWGVSC
jgi:hypothetical protein